MEKAVEENPLVVSDLRYWCIIRNRNKRVAKGNVSTCVCVWGGGGGGVEWRGGGMSAIGCSLSSHFFFVSNYSL